VGDVDWTDLTLDRDQCRARVNSVINLRISQNAGIFLSSRIIGGFSRSVQLHGVSFSYRIFQICQ
jgi:hypothetical protein